VVTELKEAGIDSYNIYGFMRWSKHSFGMLPRYVKTPQEITDSQVLDQHPFLQTWREALSYLHKYNYVRTKPSIYQKNPYWRDIMKRAKKEGV